MSEYIITCDEETASWIGNDVDEMRPLGAMTAEQVREVLLIHLPHREYYSIAQTDAWQAIADELNAELGGGNCARCAEDMGRYADSLCDPLKERIAELLRCLENDWHIHASWDGLRKFWCIELTEEGVKLRDAARAERTCEIESSYLNDFTVKNMCWYEFEMKCGYKFTWDVMEPPKFCPNCGGEVKVVDA